MLRLTLLHQLHNFYLLFGIHIKNKKPEINKIGQIIIGLQGVYEFEKVCVINVRRYHGMMKHEFKERMEPSRMPVGKDEERILLWTQES